MKFICLLVVSFSVLFSNELTVYNNNFAQIKESRDFNITKGVQTIKYSKLPETLIENSVSALFNCNGIKLISKSYQNSILNFDNLLKSNLNKTVDFYTKDKKLLQGKLISLDPIIVSSQNKNYILKADSLIYNSLPSNIDYKPFIEFNIDSNSSKECKINLSYLVSGISWTSNYMIVLNNNSLDLTAWATIKNSSGKEFKDYSINFIAGNIRKSYTRKIKRTYDSYNLEPVEPAVAEIPERRDGFISQYAPAEEIGGFYIYKLPRKITLLNGQSKEILLIKSNKIEFKKYAQVYNTDFEDIKKSKLKIRQIAEFENSQSNNLGIILPKGLVTIYKDGHYIGEKKIDNIAKNEKIKLEIGSFFGLLGERRVIKYKANKKYKNIVTEYRFKNSYNKDIELKLNELIPKNCEKVIFKSSCKKRCKIEKRDAATRIYTILIKAKENYILSSEYELYLDE